MKLLALIALNVFLAVGFLRSYGRAKWWGREVALEEMRVKALEEWIAELNADGSDGPP